MSKMLFILTTTILIIGINALGSPLPANNDISRSQSEIEKYACFNSFYSLLDDDLIITDFGLFIIRKQNKYGLLDAGKNALTPVIYDKIETFDLGLRLFKVAIDGKLGLMNVEGKEITPLKYDLLFSLNQHHLAPVGIYTDLADTLLITRDTAIRDAKPPYEFFHLKVGETFIYNSRREICWGFLFSSGKEAIPVGYSLRYDEIINPVAGSQEMANLIVVSDDCINFSCGQQVMGKGRLFGVLDTLGKVVIPFQYAQLDRCYERNCHSLYIANTGGSWEVEWGNVQKKILGGKWGLLNERGEVVIPLIYDDIRFVTDDKDYSHSIFIVNQGGERRLDAVSHEELTTRGGFWALFDIKGKPITEFEYDEIGEFEEGRATFLRGNYRGTIDFEGKETWE